MKDNKKINSFFSILLEAFWEQQLSYPEDKEKLQPIIDKWIKEWIVWVDYMEKWLKEKRLYKNKKATEGEWNYLWLNYSPKHIEESSSTGDLSFWHLY